MSFIRRVLHHGSSPHGTPVLLDDRAIAGCWFELRRQGGCGAGEIRLCDEFPLRHDIEPGDWISLEAGLGNRCYLGRVEEVRAESPAGSRIRLEGMVIQLNEVFPGGFGLQADGAPPHRYAATDLFSHDPDYQMETVDTVQTVDEVIHLLMQQYVTAATLIQYNASRIESPLHHAEVTSMKFRGEESIRSIIKDLAIRAQAASWGVDAQGEFFFLRPRDLLLTTYRESRDLTSLIETRDREHLYNRLLLTGDYIYDRKERSDAIARRTFRWRGNFVQNQSRQVFGERRIRLWLPWIRTQADSRAFAREFFRTYANPTTRFVIDTIPGDSIVIPWNGRVALEDQQGNLLTTSRIESVRVLFDSLPRLRMELGPADPLEQWPEPPHDERWQGPEESQQIGGSISQLETFHNSDQPTGSTLPPLSTLPPVSSLSSENSSDLNSSDWSSAVSSDWSSDVSSFWTSAQSSLIGSSLDVSLTDGNSGSLDPSLNLSSDPGSSSSSLDSSLLPTSLDSSGNSISQPTSVSTSDSLTLSSLQSGSSSSIIGSSALSSQSSGGGVSSGNNSSAISSDAVNSEASSQLTSGGSLQGSQTSRPNSSAGSGGTQSLFTTMSQPNSTGNASTFWSTMSYWSSLPPSESSIWISSDGVSSDWSNWP